MRTPTEYNEFHATPARNIPLDQLDPNAVIASRTGETWGDAPIYITCRSGGRATKACQKFIDSGFTNVVNLKGGTLAWEKTISLERQVRIAAGALILIGVLLTFFIHSNFLIIPTFIGAGLLFAGLTNSCTMGLLLAKMPWNK